MGARLAFGVLGPLEVRLDDVEVRVGGPRQRALLGLLLCHANRVVSRDQLIEELPATIPRPRPTGCCGFRSPGCARRSTTGTDGEPRLQARPPGYLLRVEDGELDLHAFEQQIAAGRQALADGDPARAAGLLREAEALWRGRPLADLEFESIRPAGGAAARDAPHAGRRGPDRRRTGARPARGRMSRARAARHGASAARAAARAADDRPLPLRSPGGRARDLPGRAVAAGRGAGRRAGPAAEEASAGAARAGHGPRPAAARGQAGYHGTRGRPSGRGRPRASRRGTIASPAPPAGLAGSR